MLVPERLRAVFGPALDAGAAKRAAELGPLQITGGGVLALDEDAVRARPRSWPATCSPCTSAGWAPRGRNFYNTVFARQGYPEEAELVQELYLAGRKDEAAAALPDDFVDRATLIGPPGLRARADRRPACGRGHPPARPSGRRRRPAAAAQVKEWIA